MKLFNRKKNGSGSDEIKSYYNDERRDKVGFAWLLAIGTLILTLLIALGLFYGGRWIYRTVFDDGNEAPETTQTITNESADIADEGEGDTTEDDTVTEDGTDTTDETDTTLPGSDVENGNEQGGGDEGDDDTSQLPSSGALPATGPTEPEL